MFSRHLHGVLWRWSSVCKPRWQRQFLPLRLCSLHSPLSKAVLMFRSSFYACWNGPWALSGFNCASLWILLFWQHKNTDFCYSKACWECGRDIFLIQTNIVKDVWMSRCLWRLSLGNGIVGLDCRCISSFESISFLVSMVAYLLISLTVRVPFTLQTGQYFFLLF